VSGGQGPYKDCRATDDDDDGGGGGYGTGVYNNIVIFNFLQSVMPTWSTNELVRWV
jgi:hypothetical protein